MKQLARDYPLRRVATLLEVSRGGHYRTRGQGPRARSNAKLIKQIREVFADHKARYGSPRIRLELHHRGIVCGKNRVARLMREAGLRARRPRRKVPRTTDSDHDGPIAPNRLKTLEINPRSPESLA